MARKRKSHLDVETLRIVSADGTPRMQLTTDPTHGLPYIEFLDGAGVGRALCVGLNPGNTPYFCMFRKDGIAAVGMGVNEEGEPGIRPLLPNGLPAVRIRVLASGDVDIELIDRTDNIARYRIDTNPK